MIEIHRNGRSRLSDSIGWDAIEASVAPPPPCPHAVDVRLRDGGRNVWSGDRWVSYVCTIPRSLVLGEEDVDGTGVGGECLDCVLEWLKAEGVIP